MIIDGNDVSSWSLRVLLDKHFLLVIDFENSNTQESAKEVLRKLYALEDYIVNKFGGN